MDRENTEVERRVVVYPLLLQEGEDLRLEYP